MKLNLFLALIFLLPIVAFAGDAHLGFEFNQFATDPEIVFDRGNLVPTGVNAEKWEGTFVDREWGDKKIKISRNLYVRTNIAVQDGLGNHPLQFPRKLRPSEWEDTYTTMGYYTLVYSAYPYGAITCRYPAKLVIEPDEEFRRLDAVLTVPAQYGIDAWGRCYQLGSTSAHFELEKETEDF